MSPEPPELAAGETGGFMASPELGDRNHSAFTQRGRLVRAVTAALPAGVRQRLAPVVERVVGLPGVARSVRTVVVVASGLRSEPITLRAGALTFLSVLSLVPLLAVMFSLVQAVVGTEDLRRQIQNYVLANLSVGNNEAVAKYLNQYVARARGAALGGFGFVFLLASAVSLLANVEAAFNHTFKAPKPRPLALRFGIYWCLLTVGPILIALSLSGTAVMSSTSWFAATGKAGRMLVTGLTLSFGYGLFALAYFALPAVPVRRHAAIMGALVAGTAWELAKLLGVLITSSAQRDAIYGSLSALPAFLMWVYVCWIIVLFGARVAYAAQAADAAVPEELLRRPIARELLATQALCLVGRRFERGEPPADSDRLAADLGTSAGGAMDVLEALRRAGLVLQTADGGWVPARPTSHLKLADARRAVRGGLPETPATDPGLRALLDHWEQAEAAANGRLQTSVSSHLESLATPEAPAPLVLPVPVPGRA
jgi:membrane protein